MKESFSRRDALKGLIGAGAAAAAGSAEAAKIIGKPENAELDQASILKRELDIINQKTLELQAAFKSGDKEGQSKIQKELEERFERAKKMMKYLEQK